MCEYMNFMLYAIIKQQFTLNINLSGLYFSVHAHTHGYLIVGRSKSLTTPLISNKLVAEPMHSATTMYWKLLINRDQCII